MATRVTKSQKSNEDRIKANTEFYTTKVPIPESQRSYEYVVKKRYQNLEYINAGAQGCVVSAFDKLTGTKVAIKKAEVNPTYIRNNYREIDILSRVNHENIIKVLDIFTPAEEIQNMTNIYIVMPFVDGTLNMIDTELSLEHIRYIIGNVLNAVHYLHESNIMHRDLKPGNIGIDSQSDVSLLDFGLASLDSIAKMTIKVVTKSYRAPELWLKLDYDKKIDLWSIGCILAELCVKRSIFKVDENYVNDERHLSKICEILGKPDFASLYETLSADALKNLSTIQEFETPKFDEIFSDDNSICKEGGEQLKSLLKGLLDLNPKTRLSAEEALNHPFFKSEMEEDILNNKATQIPSFTYTDKDHYFLQQRIWEKIQQYK